MKTAYIAGPINALTVEEILENCDRAVALALDLSRAGVAVICVHAIARDEVVACNGDVTGDRLQQCLDQDFRLIEIVDALVLVTADYAKSNSTTIEVAHAKEHGKPVLTPAEAMKWAQE